MNNVIKALNKRRSRYTLNQEITMSDDQLKQMIHDLVRVMPSPMNTQPTRLVILTGGEHDRLWDITLEELKKIAKSETAFEKTLDKVNKGFKGGYGTILFYQDLKIIRALEEKYPRYAHNFPSWSTQTNAMHQIMIWTALAEEGIGASLQHYNELIDNRIRREWGISEDWKLYAQMPFGIAVDQPGEKEVLPLEERVLFHHS